MMPFIGVISINLRHGRFDNLGIRRDYHSNDDEINACCARCSLIVCSDLLLWPCRQMALVVVQSACQNMLDYEINARVTFVVCVQTRQLFPGLVDVQAEGATIQTNYHLSDFCRWCILRKQPTSPLRGWSMWRELLC
jgi:hypothetical protein